MSMTVGNSRISGKSGSTMILGISGISWNTRMSENSMFVRLSFWEI